MKALKTLEKAVKTDAKSCLRLCKDTKIKANHNNNALSLFDIKLSKTLQRYENKSKSQHP